jgi:hypothetical protein
LIKREKRKMISEMNKPFHISIMPTYGGPLNGNEPEEGYLDDGELEMRHGEQLTPWSVLAVTPHPTHLARAAAPYPRFITL